jgi:O-antigen/teichoic acid export membrane protein
MSSSNSFFKNSMLNFNRNIITMILGLASTIIIARVLGPEKQGIFTLVLLLPTMLTTFFNIGIGSATVYYIGKKKYELTTIVSTNIFLAFTISLTSIVIGFLFIYFFGDTFLNGVPKLLLLIIMGGLPLVFLNTFLQAIFQGLQDFVVYNLIVIAGNVVNIVFILITLLVLQLDLIGALVSYFSSIITPTLILFVYLRKRNLTFKLKSVSKSFIKDCIYYGYKVHFSNILSFINYRADLILLSYFLNPAAVGVYNVSVSITEKLWIVSQPVSTVLFPKISSSNSNKERNLLTTMVARNVLMLSFLVSLLLFFTSEYFILLLFGEKYQAAANIIKILLVGITLLSAEKILSNDLAGRGKPELNLYTSLLTIIINIILNIIFIPIWGVNGAAVATTISYSLTFFVKLIIFCNETKVNYLSVILFNKDDVALYIKIIKGLRR